MVDHYLIYGVRKISAWLKSRKPKVINSRNMREFVKAQIRHDLPQVYCEAILCPFSDKIVNMEATFHEIFK